jgi:hypothetical protein
MPCRNNGILCCLIIAHIPANDFSTEQINNNS